MGFIVGEIVTVIFSIIVFYVGISCRLTPEEAAVADEPDADQVYIGYETDVSLPDGSPGVEQGVAAVSLADGDIAWTEALDTGPEGGHASAALLASLLHDGVLTVEEIKADLLGRGLAIRP